MEARKMERAVTEKSIKQVQEENGLITSVHKNSQNTQELLCHRKENIMEGYKVFDDVTGIKI